MQIAIDIRHLAASNLSGVGHYTVKLIEEMARVSQEDTFILFASGTKSTLELLPKFNAPNIKLEKYLIPNRILYGLLAMPGGPALEDFLYEKPDVWLFPNLNIIRTNLSYALTVHDLSFQIMPRFFTRKDRAWYKVARVDELIHRAYCILSVSESTKQDLIELFGTDKSKICVTHLGIDEIYNPKEQPSDRNYLVTHGIKFPYLLTLSTLEPRKNIETVIEAYSSWREKYPAPSNQYPELVIAGGRGWKSRGIDKALAASRFKQNIHLIGYVPERHKPALYRHAEALLFPSYYEGFGLPPLEAMACGTPVVASFTGSIPEVVGDAAILVDPFDVTDLEMAIGELMRRTGEVSSPYDASTSQKGLETRPLRQMLRTRGLARASRFRWSVTAELTLEAIKSIK